MVLLYNESMSKLRNSIWYEWYLIDDLWYAKVNGGNAIPKKMGTRVLGETTITTGIDTIPTMTITIPLEDFPTDELNDATSGTINYYEPRMQRYLMVVHIQVGGIEKYNFRGVIDTMDIDYANYLVQLNLSHEVARMREWAMPVNYCLKDSPLDHVIGKDGAALGYPNPQLTDGNSLSLQSYNAEVEFDFSDFTNRGVEMPRVEMTFSSNNKLEGLSEVLKNTEFCHFWVRLDRKTPTIVIQSYETELDQAITQGELTISPYPVDEDDCDDIPSPNQITLLTEPTFNVDYTSHYNRAVVFCGDIQDGVNHLTLEHIYADKSLQIDGFPVNKYEYELNQTPETEYDSDGKKINNEKIYRDYDIIAYAQNGNREFYIEDTKQLEDDRGIVLNTTFNFSTLYPIPSLKEDVNNDGTLEELVITDDDRLAIEKQAYLCAVRKLRAQRPERTYQFNCTAFPYGTYDGQPVRLAYSKTVNQYSSECENEFDQRKILNINQLFYLTKRTITFDEGMNENTTTTLSSELKSKELSAIEIELRQKAATAKEDKEDVTDYVSYYNPYRHRNELSRWADGTISSTEDTLSNRTE